MWFIIVLLVRIVEQSVIDPDINIEDPRPTTPTASGLQSLFPCVT